MSNPEMTNEVFLFEITAHGDKLAKKAEKRLNELLEECGDINSIPHRKMKEVHRIANGGGTGFLNSKGEIWQHHPH